MRCTRNRCICTAAGLGLLTCSAVSATADAQEVDSTNAAEARDPFWPVGYQPAFRTMGGDAPRLPAENRARAVDSEWTAAQKLLVVSGVMRSGQTADRRPVYGVLINGQFVEVGGLVSVSLNGMTFRWRVVRVTESGPVYERVTNEERKDRR